MVSGEACLLTVIDTERTQHEIRCIDSLEQEKSCDRKLQARSPQYMYSGLLIAIRMGEVDKPPVRWWKKHFGAIDNRKRHGCIILRGWFVGNHHFPTKSMEKEEEKGLSVA